ncbi:Ribonuclease H1, partial [Termitomyces sp. J132]
TREVGPPKKIIVFTDGSCENNKYENAIAEAGVWFGTEDDHNIAIHLPENIKHSNNAREIMAILLAAINTPDNNNLEIMSNSKTTMDGLTKYLTTWKDQGWIGIANKELLKATVFRLRFRNGQAALTKVQGHADITRNKGADSLPKEGAEGNNIFNGNTSPVPGFYHLGTKLNMASHALLYKEIIERKKQLERKGTKVNLEKVKLMVREITVKTPPDELIWTTIQNHVLTKEACIFLWKTIYNAYKVEKYWKNILDYKYRSMCQVCEKEDSMMHILTQCTATGQKKYRRW